MTGAAIVRWKAGEAVVLAVHGAFDGASAWSLRLSMEESPAREFIIDLTHAEEACEFAAGLLAGWAGSCRRERRIRFVPGSPEHARLLSGYGLELVDDDVDTGPALAGGFPFGSPAAGSGATA